jgi:uncharacterized protein (TIGR00725 family)
MFDAGSGVAGLLSRAQAQSVPESRVGYIGVIGPSQATPAQLEVAYAVGREIALAGAVLICGGRGGVMEAAARGASEAPVDPPATVIGILPGSDRAAANPFVTVAIATGLGQLRNAVVASSSDGLIAVGGNPGTLIEMAFALQHGRPVVSLGGWSVLDQAGDPIAGLRRAETPADALRLVL